MFSGSKGQSALMQPLNHYQIKEILRATSRVNLPAISLKTMVYFVTMDKSKFFVGLKL